LGEECHHRLKEFRFEPSKHGFRLGEPKVKTGSSEIKRNSTVFVRDPLLDEIWRRVLQIKWTNPGSIEIVVATK
jgi:hypothetical protein